MHQSSLVEKRVKEIKRRTRKKDNTQEKIRIVLEGLKGESSIAGLCRREGINLIFYHVPYTSKNLYEFHSQTKNPMNVGGDVVERVNLF